MALQDIFKALDEQADAECKEALDNAKAQAQAVVAEAKEEAQRIRDRKIEQAEVGVARRAAQLVNASRLENKRDIAALKDRGVESVFDDALAALGKLRSSGGYEDLFKTLAEEALASMEGDVEVHIDARDQQVAKKVLDGTGVRYTLKPELETAGGLVAVYGAGRVFRRNTLEDRLAKVRQIAQSQVSEILFT